MRILVLNAGSSSLKCGVFDTHRDKQPFKLSLERLDRVEAGLDEAVTQLAAQGINGFDAVAHRVAHGGATLRDACVVTPEVEAAIDAAGVLAPLHNPPALAVLRQSRRQWPGLPQVAVFDTAFHQTLPARAHTYAVPAEWRATGLRRYGFHGTSHKYVMQHAARALNTTPQDLRLISCHLGNGASVCAIERGVSVDTSMGMTPLEGLVMGSRSGDVDPGLFAHLQRTLGLSVEQIEDGLYHRSGLAALSGVGNDLRDIEARAATGDAGCQLAIQVYAYRVRSYIGAYAAAMGGVDAIAFTGGIGEHSASMRKRICERLDFLGLQVDEDANASLTLQGFEVASLHEPTSRVKLLVTATREQWMIANEAARVLAPTRPALAPHQLPIAVSAHHVHLTTEAVQTLFGTGHTLRPRNPLSQPGQWAAEETVDVIGPRGELHHLRVLGPCRAANQIEVSQTEAFALGVDAPLRLSGQTTGTPVVTLRGPAGTLRTDGLIVAQRHLHAHTRDAAALGLADGDAIDIEVHSDGRDLVFSDVIVRVSEQFVTEVHLDTDEANAARLSHGGSGELIRLLTAHAQLRR